MPKIGGHVSTAGGLDLSFDRAQEITADCVQLFISPPQTWNHIEPPEEVVKKYLEKLESTKIQPNFVHGVYLINLASDNPANLSRSIGWLKYSLRVASLLKITGTIFHVGSHKGVGFEKMEPQVVQAIKTILEETDQYDSYLILENSASLGNAIGGKLFELGSLLKKVNHPRLKVCIDTQHAFASGYDLTNKDGVEKMVKEIEDTIGIEHVVAIHTNDSKMALGSGRDRHENIGEGLIGKDGFGYLLNHPKLQHLPFILEVPGLKDTGPDKENIDILRSLVSK